MAEERHRLYDLLEDQIKDLYSAEKQIIAALPKMAKAATNPQLKAGFLKHLAETRGHAARLEQIAKALDFSPRGKKCKGCEGLIEEGKEAMKEHATGTSFDAALIGAAQRVEHYEMAGYGTARTHARTLGLIKVAKMLQQTLDDEGRTDKKLTQLAESVVNTDALDG